ncbi:response regulator [Oceanisphaera sp. IT1-181]|uniref:response regulator n=1 Tax=Oceanisphaera sp. IT1-181 TaxID=3081199 RepID=UPI0029C9CBF6|nr:response regulator [Oceanisphaera sp. IT1-181]
MNNKVLIVEDELIFGQNLKLYLEAQQFDIQIARDGASAINLIKGSFMPDIIVLDFRLPDMPGFQVLDEIRQYWHGHCVLMTGNPSSEVSAQAIQYGVKYILFKPFPLAELACSVRTLINTSQYQKQDSVSQSGLTPKRRRHQSSHFPLQMYDGTWIYADRRQSDQADNLDANSAEKESVNNNDPT